MTIPREYDGVGYSVFVLIENYDSTEICRLSLAVAGKKRVSNESKTTAVRRL